MKEYKIKWEIELESESPEAAAKLALDMIQSKDSDAKVFEVDGELIDVVEVQDRELWIKTATDIVGDAPLKFSRGVKTLKFEDDKWTVTVIKDKAYFDMEEVESFEQARGELRGHYFILDYKQ
jgi:hypothetical protein